MAPEAIALIALAGMLVLMAAGVPIAVSMGVASFVGLVWVRDVGVAASVLSDVPIEFSANWILSAVPMFLLMGSVAHRGGLITDIFRAARLWLSSLPGGLALSTTLGSA